MADNKVKFLRGTAAEYAASTKDNDVFYYITDTQKLYLGANEVTGVGKAGTGASAEIFNDYTQNKANGNYSHAEGLYTKADGSASHSEGAYTDATGDYSHTEGYSTTASKFFAHAGGDSSSALKRGAFVHGNNVIADKNDYETAFGTFNKSNADTLFSVGNGISTEDRSNAFEITKTTGKLFDKEIATKEDIPTTLPANGGNADTLDGKHANEIANNPNMLINPNFVINQRGGNIYSYSVASGSIDGGFTVDHWISTIVGSGNSGSYNAETHILSGSVLDKNGYYANLYQLIENPVRFAGKTLTFSAGMSELDQPALIQIWRTEGTTTTGVAATHYNLEADKVLTFTMPSDLTEASKIRVVLQTRGSVKLDWAKLELGSAATPFVPPDPATELLRCQRYFTIYKHQNATSNTDKCSIGIGYALTGSIVYAVLPIAAMRSGVAATVSYSGLTLINGTDTVVDFSSATALEQTDSTVQVAFTVSGQTPGTVYRLRLMNSDAYLAVSKEL